LWLSLPDINAHLYQWNMRYTKVGNFARGEDMA
jgi:hypothetical protein